jgi:uncharacterized phage protein gp47/JayE
MKNSRFLDAFGDETDNHDVAKVCGIDVPTADQLAAEIQKDIGGTIHQSKGNTQEAANKVYTVIAGTAYDSKEKVEAASRKVYEAIKGTFDDFFTRLSPTN